jgi:formate hydrogenlyase subunit 3/multisubunit Na+/H+ antiporter MnhD subunit
MAGRGITLTRTRRPVAVILAGALCCFGVVLVVSYFYYVSPEAGGSIVHTRVLWGGIMCIFVGAVWAYSNLFGKE